MKTARERADEICRKAGWIDNGAIARIVMEEAEYHLREYATDQRQACAEAATMHLYSLKGAEKLNADIHYAVINTPFPGERR